MARLPRFMAIKYNCFAPSKESRPSQSPGNRITSRNEDAQSPSVVSIDAPTIHDPPNHGGLWIQNPKQNATVMLVSPGGAPAPPERVGYVFPRPRAPHRRCRVYPISVSYTHLTLPTNREV